MKNVSILFFGLFLGFQCIGQEIFSDPDYIKTVVLKPNRINSYAPIIRLGEKLELSFDDLNADQRDYSYKIVHCTADWLPSGLLSSEYIDGYNEDRIWDYENSFNTLQAFTNYTLSIPNDQTRIIISGNYILSILNDAGDLIFTRRFVVYEPKVTVAVGIYRSRDITSIEKKQAVEFTVNHPGFRINNPDKEIYPVILQNSNWQTALSGFKPQYFRGTQLLYKYNKETSFWAGNEFLYFDSKSIRNTTLNIGRVILGDELYHTHLYTNDERIDKPYTLFPDINGNFIIRSLDGLNPNTDADYSWVHFSLSCLENLNNKDLYVHGNFNNWQLQEANKLVYNASNGLYETSILLKQGFYNYQYLTVSDQNEMSNYDVDGSFYQTENTYTVLIYYKKFGSRYDRVIGVGYGNSEKFSN